MTDVCGFCREATDANSTSKEKSPKVLLCTKFKYIGKKKRKLLNGPSCKVEAALLKKALIRYSGRGDVSYYCHGLFNNPSTFLCVKCQKTLLKHNSVEEELARLNADVNAKCGALIRMFSVRDDSNITEPPAKRILMPSTGTDRPGTAVSSSTVPSMSSSTVPSTLEPATSMSPSASTSSIQSRSSPDVSVSAE